MFALWIIDEYPFYSFISVLFKLKEKLGMLENTVFVDDCQKRWTSHPVLLLSHLKMAKSKSGDQMPIHPVLHIPEVASFWDIEKLDTNFIHSAMYVDVRNKGDIFDEKEYTIM